MTSTACSCVSARVLAAVVWRRTLGRQAGQLWLTLWPPTLTAASRIATPAASYWEVPLDNFGACENPVPGPEGQLYQVRLFNRAVAVLVERQCAGARQASGTCVSLPPIQ